MKFPIYAKAIANHPNWIYGAVLLLISLMPFSQSLSAKLLVLVFIFCCAFLMKKAHAFQLVLKGWDLLVWYVVLLLGVSYSQDKVAALRVLETSFSFVALPIVINMVELTPERLRRCIYTFIASVSAASAACLLHATFKYWNGAPITVLTFESLTGTLSMQPTYFAYYLIFAITGSLYFIYSGDAIGGVGYLATAVLLLFTTLMLTAGKTAFISILLVFVFFILRFLHDEHKTKLKTGVFASSIALLGIMLFVSSTYFKSGYTHDTTNTDYWERIELWQAAIHASKNYLVGVGTGDYSQLSQYYKAQGLLTFAKANLNAHNQYLQTFFTSGIIGLLSFLILLIRPIYLSLRYRQVLGVLVFFSFVIYGMTEVFLGRYQGVVFFTLLHQLFIGYYIYNAPSYLVKT